MAVRTALGASRGRLIRQLLTESLQLSLIGSILGILLAPVCIKLLTVAFLPSSATSLPIDIGINRRVMLLTLGIGLITALIFGLVPALHASKTDLTLAMKDESPTLHAGSRRFGIRNLFVMAQISASLVLLIVAGLFIRSLQKAQHVDLGYDINNVLTLRPTRKSSTNPTRRHKSSFTTRCSSVSDLCRALKLRASLTSFLPAEDGARLRSVSRITLRSPRRTWT
jgi:predicted lysophospholipase L1 biosynthesis ABC-type transport system permease subunit